MPAGAAAVRDFAPDREESAGRYTFPRSHRLLHSREFQHVFKSRNARRAQGHTARCVWVPNGRSGARLGLAVSKRALRRNVDRNRFKRQAREYFRQHPLAGVDLVITCRRGVKLPLDRRAVQADLVKFWRTINS